MIWYTYVGVVRAAEEFRMRVLLRVEVFDCSHWGVQAGVDLRVGLGVGLLALLVVAHVPEAIKIKD